MKPSVSNVAVGLLLLFVGHAFGMKNAPVQTQIVMDTVATAQYVQTVADLRMQRNGLRAQLAGVSELQPQRIVVTDTVVQRDTVLSFVTIRDGTLSTETLIKVPPPGPLIADHSQNCEPTGICEPSFRPELRTGYDVSACDDGLEVSADGVVCNRPRFGHMSLFAGLDTRSTGYGVLGAMWTPSFRSNWDVSGGVDGDGWFIGITRGVRLW